MLTTKSLKIKWCANQKKYYENKGYIFTKIGDEFEVKFEDIPHSSDKYIECECDYCNMPYSVQIKKYYRGKAISDKDACSNCRTIKGTECKIIKYGTASPTIYQDSKEKWLQINIPKKIQVLNQMIQTFKDKNCIMMPSIYVNNETKMPYICKKHMDKGIQWNNWIHLKSGRGCYYCCIESRKGECNGNWNGGITTLNSYLRNCIEPWVKDSLNKSNYICDISNRNGYLEVHHLYKNFKDIVDETLNLTNISVKRKIGEYSSYELELLAKTCLDLHYKYGLGVCILREYHLDFHNFYGRYNNTPEQYFEFKNEIQLELQQESLLKDSLLLCSNSQGVKERTGETV